MIEVVNPDGASGFEHRQEFDSAGLVGGQDRLHRGVRQRHELFGVEPGVPRGRFELQERGVDLHLGLPPERRDGETGGRDLRVGGFG